MYSERSSPHRSPLITHSHDFSVPFRMLNQASWSSSSLPLRNHGGCSSNASNAGSILSNDRVAIDLMLNPILDSSSNSQTRISLPSIRTLDVHRYAERDLSPLDSLHLQPHSASYYHQSPVARMDLPPFQSSLSPRERHLFKRIKARRGSHSSTASCSVSPPSPPGSTYCQYTPNDSNITSCPTGQQEQSRQNASYSQSQQSHEQYYGDKQHKTQSQQHVQQGHSNKKYTTEEMHFIQYFREDKRMQWADIVGPFNAQFPNHKRERGALECRYYRFQMYPQINEDGTFQYNDKNEIVMVNTKVRDRRDTKRSGGKKWSILNDYFKLVSRCPEQVLEYHWTDEEDKRRARAISKSTSIAT